MTDEMRDDLRRLGLLDEPALGAFWREGHFVYESGDHGDVRLALELLFADPPRLRRAAIRLAGPLRSSAPDIVCGALVGGALLGQWVAFELGVPFVYAEPRRKDAPAGAGYAVPDKLRSAVSGARVVVVDDAINAGAATGACVREVEGLGGRVVACAALIVRVPGALPTWTERGIGVESLVAASWNVWPASGCPLCRAGVPLETA